MTYLIYYATVGPNNVYHYIAGPWTIVPVALTQLALPLVDAQVDAQARNLC